jgi:putative flippase GtrA
MIPLDRFTNWLRNNFPRTAALVVPHLGWLCKAVSFAMIGVLNVLVDTSVFLLAYSYLKAMPQALRLLDALPNWCECVDDRTATLVTANTASWLVAVSFSYAMNSFITFAAESGRRLQWKAYGTFVASGVLGAVINTTALVMAAQFMPVLAAKGCAILAGFVVNFSMSHFVVFRHKPAEKATMPAQ